MKFTEYLRLNESESTVQPKDLGELRQIITDTVKEKGLDCDLNFIDTSKITDMTLLFNAQKLQGFNGDISKWDVSNVKSMECMFMNSYFNGDISKWDVSNVENMECMFANSKFNQDISKWDVSSVETMRSMFEDSVFNRDISRWTPRKLRYADNMFTKSKFSRDLSKWKLSKKIFGTIVEDMFKFSPLEDKEEFWPEKV